jgi:hypothetical protein
LLNIKKEVFMAGKKKKSSSGKRSSEHMAEMGRKESRAKGRGTKKKIDDNGWNKKESPTEELEDKDLP